MSLFVSVLLLAVLGVARSLTMMPPKTKTVEHIPLAKKAMEFLDSSPDPFHAVQTTIDLLRDAGFTEVQDIEPNSEQIQPGTKKRLQLIWRRLAQHFFSQYSNIFRWKVLLYKKQVNAGGLCDRREV